MRSNRERQWYILIGLLLAVLGTVGIGLVWTRYYDLNDDMLMQQILSGAYTGTPASHNIQNLYPFSLIVSALYRVTAGLDWYALVLLAIAAICYALTVARVLARTTEHRFYQAAGVVAITLLYGGVLLYHLVYVQYTIIVGMMGATAAFLVFTSDDADSVRGFLRANRMPFILIYVGYAIRSEMMMFMLPFVAAAVLFRILPLRDAGAIMRRILASLLVMGIGIGVIYGIDAAAYSSPAWSEFRNLFDARTQLYDFASVPAYDGNEEFYDSIGLDASEVTLLSNYNYGIDADIDAETMQAVADYAAAQRLETKSVRERLQEAAWVYLYQKVTGGSEMPWNLVAFVLYGLVFIAGVFEILSAVMDLRSLHRDAQQSPLSSGQITTGEQAAHTQIWSAVGILAAAGFLLVIRSGLWIYLLYAGRPVARLTHSMYYAEALLLLAVLFYHRRLDVTAPLKATFVLFALVYAMGAQTTLIGNEAERRTQNNAAYTALLTYTDENPTSFYLVDVYSTVDFSAQMFDNSRASSNWNLLGGWACKSPVEAARLSAYGIDSMETALTSDTNVYYVARSEYDTEWIVEYYASRGVKVVVNRVDTVGEYWSIYSVDTWDL